MNRKIAYGCLFVLASGCQVAASDSTDDSDQSASQVVVSSVADGDYVVRSVATKHCLDVSGASTADGAVVQEWTCNGTKAQVFHVKSLGDGFVEITNVKSGKSLDIKDVSTAQNARLQQWTYSGGANQQFKLVSRGNSEFSIQARHTDMALDLAWGKADDGTPIVQYPYWGGDNQRWTFDKQGGSTGGGTTGGGSTGGGTTNPAVRSLKITNNCAQPIWIMHSSNVEAAQNTKLATGAAFTYNVPDGGIASTRFWPKTGCDSSGLNCSSGESSPPCGSNGCQPPFESKFEATFAAKGGADQTWYNLSQVDGYSLPFKVTPVGTGAGQGNCIASDCSGLSLDRCPGSDNLSEGGAFGAYAHEDLRVRDKSGKVVGCMAPCKKLNYPAPWGHGLGESQDPTLHMCCPTPFDPATGKCTAANGCMTSQACSNEADPRSVTHTSYVQVMHEMCPTAYSYAYDDAAGLHACSSQTSFEVVFCP